MSDQRFERNGLAKIRARFADPEVKSAIFKDFQDSYYQMRDAGLARSDLAVRYTRAEHDAVLTALGTLETVVVECLASITALADRIADLEEQLTSPEPIG